VKIKHHAFKNRFDIHTAKIYLRVGLPLGITLRRFQM